MKRLLLTTIFCAAASAAQAQHISNIGTFGYWTAFGGTDTTGVPVCGMHAALINGSTTLFKWYYPNQYLTIQIIKPSWPLLTPSYELKLDMHFDSWDAWHGTAAGLGWTANGTANSGGGIEAQVLPKSPDGETTNITRFLNQVAEANTMILSFPDGDEPNWNFSLMGSHRAVDALLYCVGATLRAHQPPTTPTLPGASPGNGYIPPPPPSSAGPTLPGKHT